MDFLLWWLLRDDRFGPGKDSLCVAGGTSVLDTDLRISVTTTDGLLVATGPAGRHWEM